MSSICQTVLNKYNKIDKVVKGWLTKGEFCLLGILASKAHPQKWIVEVGSYQGRSTIALATGSRHGNKSPFMAIDPHLTHSIYPSGVKYLESDLEQYYLNLVTFDVHFNVHTMNVLSERAALTFDNGSVGFLFIDGDHSYEGVKSDLNAWLPKLAYGAIVAFHDINEAGVRVAMEETKELQSFCGIDNLMFCGYRGIYRESMCSEQEVEEFNTLLKDTSGS